MDSKAIAGQYKEHKKGAAEGKKGMGRMGVAALAVGTAPKKMKRESIPVSIVFMLFLHSYICSIINIINSPFLLKTS